MDKLRTIRSQSARIVEDENGLFSIEIYANGKWGKPASGYDKKFKTKEVAEKFFTLKRDCIHS